MCPTVFLAVLRYFALLVCLLAVSSRRFLTAGVLLVGRAGAGAKNGCRHFRPGAALSRLPAGSVSRLGSTPGAVVLSPCLASPLSPRFAERGLPSTPLSGRLLLTYLLRGLSVLRFRRPSPLPDGCRGEEACLRSFGCDSSRLASHLLSPHLLTPHLRLGL